MRKAGSSRERTGKRDLSPVKYKLTLEYDGTGYSGWQMQKNAKSIQGTLIRAAEKLLGSPVDIQGAGRTDAGVHALAQVAHLETTRKMPPRKLLESLNDALPSSINILRVEETDPLFHARHSAQLRSYLYVISGHRTAFGKRYVWWIRDHLELKKMQAASELFSGFHDFSSFADKRLDRQAATRVKVEATELQAAGDLIFFRVTGSHFLWKMVRRMVGVLVEVGRENLSLSDVRQMLKSPSDEPARLTAPPSGLFLEQVFYEGDSPRPLALPLVPWFTIGQHPV
ncbi:MAG: tRNA pseudouridine synthase A [Syntrophus sp. PtaU1.Bin208]|nr:MAG: tRNA pseudouridine synthase A [Syntrophus sp. PtaU1.Bin208]